MKLQTTAIAALAFLVIGPAARAQQPVAVQDSTVVFDFQAADLRVVISALADVAGLNIVYGDLPVRSVTLRTSRPVKVSQVRSLLENVVRANGLEMVEEGGLTRIVPAAPPEGAPVEGPGALLAGPEGRKRRLYVYRLRYARAARVVQTLSELFGLGRPAGAAEPEGPTSLSEQLSAQAQVTYRETEQLRAKAMGLEEQAAPAAAQGEEGGVDLGLKGVVDMVPDPLTNSILIMATPADYEVVQGAIREVDTRPRQVLIEVMIAEVRHTDSRDLGVTIDVPLKEGDDSGVTFHLQGRSAGEVALQVLGIGAVKASVIIEALAAVSDVTILSRPVVLAQNNQEARIMVGDQRPFIQVFRSLPTDAAVRDQVVQYRNVGTQLVIRPTINADGYVDLSVLQEVSTATAETQFGAPVINTRETETELLVQDGHTVVLGGLLDHQQEQTHSGIPVLKDLPLLGGLFRSTQERTVANELFLLLTPHVIETDEEMDETTRKLRGAAKGLNEKLPTPIPLLRSGEGAADSVPAAAGGAAPPDSAPPAEPTDDGGTDPSPPPGPGGGGRDRPR